MKSEKQRPKARQFLQNLTAGGRLYFNTAEAQAVLGGSAAAVKVALSRLAKQRAIASPFRGFYVSRLIAGE